MISPLLPANETERLQVLHECHILDTHPEPAFDNIAALAASICQTPIALISFIDRHRQWFKAKVGLGISETPREFAFCAYTIFQPTLFTIPDASQDTRFAHNPLVVAGPKIRFYAGAPLIVSKGCIIGTLCVIDHAPRELTLEQLHGLRLLACRVVDLLERRRQQTLELEASLKYFTDQLQDSLNDPIDQRDMLEDLYLLQQLKETETQFVEHTETQWEKVFRQTQQEQVATSQILLEALEDLEAMQKLARRQSQFVTRLLSQYCHLLSVVQSIATSLDNTRMAVQTQELLQVVRNLVILMIHQLEDVLLVIQANLGTYELSPNGLDLTQFCQAMIRQLQQVHRNDRKIQFFIQGNPHRAYLDLRLLGQILGHVLGNAIHYSSRASVITLKLIYPDSETVIFQIQDQGIGIPIADQPNIFEMFYRGSNANQLPGTGIGLTVVKKAVELQGGDITVESIVGVGSTFTITLPLDSGRSQSWQVADQSFHPGTT
ncbi:MAG: GAF domain-containing protein [Leptolyngbyaceae cyanobacterium SL_7_1]|nr:GAF domain-containing protein [Leptolyngbyaceae cyanobacterium SL_7_1]